MVIVLFSRAARECSGDSSPSLESSTSLWRALLSFNLLTPCDAQLKVGEWTREPLSEQIFPGEWEALTYLKRVCPTTSHYHDEFLFACLFSRKMDIARTIEIVEKNWKVSSSFLSPRSSILLADSMLLCSGDWTIT